MRGRPARRRVVYVIEGALEHQIESEQPATVKAGKALFMPAEAIQVVKNIGSGNAAELATYVAKKGKPLVVSGQVRTGGDGITGDANGARGGNRPLVVGRRTFPLP
jgi:hypothetical protein